MVSIQSDSMHAVTIEHFRHGRGPTHLPAEAGVVCGKAQTTETAPVVVSRQPGKHSRVYNSMRLLRPRLSH